MRPILVLPVDRVEGGVSRADEDLVAVEEPLQITVDGEDLVITMRTPGHDVELATGFLFSEGLIQRPDQIESVTPDNRGTIRVSLAEGSRIDPGHFTRNFYQTSSCGVCGKASIEALRMQGCPTIAADTPRVSSSLISSLHVEQPVFERTGGLHAAGLFDAQTRELLLSREDVGRHNAVDKLIGAAFHRKLLPLSNSILWLSGRVSFELVQKALRAGIPIVVAVGAPSSLAIETARRFGMTLAGFVRDGRFNVYSGGGRIV